MSDLQPYNPDELRPYLEALSNAATLHAQANAFENYKMRKSANTLATHGYALQTFTDYLSAAFTDANLPQQAKDIKERGFFDNAEAWTGIKWGTVQGFVQWMLKEGFAISSINQKLSVVKTYFELAGKAGIIPPNELVYIRGVRQIASTERGNVDDKRAETRLSTEKEHATLITDDQARQLKKPHDERVISLRDALLMCVLLDHGLRASEASLLTRSSFDETYLRFRRPKVTGTRYEFATHLLSKDTRRAWEAYRDNLKSEAVFPRTTNKGTQLGRFALPRDQLSKRVNALGKQVLGIDTLSAHDCRHHLATKLSRAGRTMQELMDHFGWSSAETAKRYVEAAAIGNFATIGDIDEDNE